MPPTLRPHTSSPSRPPLHVRVDVDTEARLLFSDLVPKAEHVVRGAAADLFLDTPLCNAHTTGTDILWSGTPMLTLQGITLASRVGGSLVHALGLPELAVQSIEEYETTAVGLGSDLARLRSLQARVRCGRLRQPLFNTVGWVRDFDQLLFAIFDDFCDGRVADRATAVTINGVTSGAPPRALPAVAANADTAAEAALGVAAAVGVEAMRHVCQDKR